MVSKKITGKFIIKIQNLSKEIFTFNILKYTFFKNVKQRILIIK